MDIEITMVSTLELLNELMVFISFYYKASGSKVISFSREQ